MVDIASLAIQIDTSDVARAENDLERLGAKGAKAEQAAKGVGDAYQQAAGKVGGVAGAATQAGTALERNSVAARENARELASVDRTASSLSGSMSKLGATLAGLTAGMSIKGIIDISDNYGQMADRIKMATASTEEYRMVQERLLQSANRTYRPLAEAQELYIRTADAIRSLGYQTSDALDITDSFSYLLVTNAASADKASNAIDAYSKSIQSGRIEVDSWQSLIAAMPSVVDTLSGSLGKSAEEIRQLGITGKLSLADLNEGLRQTVEQNQKLADGMGTTLNDAIVRASNNLSIYLGESSKVTASSRLLSGALDGVTENIDLIATTLGGVAVAAVARYATVTAKSTAASVAQTIAAGRQAAEELKLAQAQVASATAAVALARANVGLTASTGQVTAALAAQEAAQKRLAAAQSASVGLGRTVLGLAGGWAGLAVTAGAVALSFVDWGDGAEEAARKSIALREETNLLTRAVEDLDAAQAKQVLQRMEEPYQAAKDEARNYAAQIEYLNAQLDRHPGSAKVEEWNRSLVDAKGNLSTVNQELATQEAKMRDLNARIEQNTNAWKGNREAASETDKEGQSFLASLQRRADLSGKLTEVQKTQISIEKGYAGSLSETAKQEALAASAVIDRANAAANAGKGIATEAKQQAKALQDFLAQSSVAVTSANDMAAAYLKGASSIAELAAQQKVEEQLLKTGASARAEVTKAVNEQQSALDRLDIAELIAKSREMNADLKAQVAVYKESTKSVGEGAEAQRKYNIEKQVSAALAGKNASALSKETAELLKQLGIQEDIREELEAHRKIAGLIESTATAQEKLNRRMEELNELMAYAKTPEQITAIQRAMKEAQDDASQWAKWTESALERVDSAFADAWRNIGDGFSSFADSLKNAFSQMLAELAHMAITRPIVMQIGAALGIGGGSAGAGLMSLGGGAGGSGGSLLADAWNYGSSAYSAVTSGFGRAVMAGWNSGGLTGAFAGGWGYGSNAIGNLGSTIGGWFGGGSSASLGASQAGYMGSGFANWLNGGSAGIGATQAGYTGAAMQNWVALQNAGNWGTALTGAGASLGGVGGALYGYGKSGWKGAVTGGLGGWGGAAAGSVAGASIGTAIGGTLGSILPGIGTAIGAALGSYLGGSLFGGKWQTKDVGIALGIESGALSAQEFEYQKKKGGLLSSNKKRTRYYDLDPETAAALGDAYAATADGVFDLFESLSFTIEDSALAGLDLAKTHISTMGKTEEEIQQAIAEWFGTAADAMTAELQSVLGTGLDLDFAGMQAFVGNLKGINEVLRYLDVGMYDASVAGGKLAEALSAAAGGLDALAANSQTYYAAFFSEAEKVEDTIDSIKRTFESADVELAASREAYRAMVEDIDLTTEAGQEMFATLMALSGQAATYYSILEAQLLGAANSAYTALQRSIAAQQREIQASASKVAGNISALTGIGNSLDAALKKLRGTSDDTVRSLRAQAVMTLNSALVQARSGQSLAGFDGLQDALDTASQMDTALYGSLEQFEREQGRTANLIAELEKVNGKQLSVEQQVLKSLESQLSALDQQLLFAQSQLDALNGVDNSVLSVVDAINAMNSSVVAALSLMGGKAGQNATPTNVGTLVESVYRSVLGRDADAGGLAYWQNDVATGAIRLDQLEQAIKNAARENGELRGFAVGGYTGAGDKWDPAGIVHKGEVVWSQSDIAKWGGVGTVEAMRKGGPELEVTGPSRIYNASQTAAMLGGGDSSAAIASLQRTVEGQSAALRSIAKHTMQTAKRVEFLERWDFDGLPKERAIA